MKRTDPDYIFPDERDGIVYVKVKVLPEVREDLRTFRDENKCFTYDDAIYRLFERVGMYV